MAGASGDPLCLTRWPRCKVALYDSANKQASRSFAKSFNAFNWVSTLRYLERNCYGYSDEKGTPKKLIITPSQKVPIKYNDEVEKDSVIDDVIKNLKTPSRH